MSRSPSSLQGKVRIRSLTAFAMVVALLSPMAGAEDEGSTGPVYVALEPEFTVNYGEGNRLRYLQAAITLQVADNNAALEVNVHSDALRHEIIMAISEQTTETIRSSQNRQVMQEELSERLRALMEEETGEPRIEQVLFTSFVVQG